MGSLYNRIRDPNQIKSMRYAEMRYWVEWNKAIDRGHEEAMREARSQG